MRAYLSLISVLLVSFGSSSPQAGAPDLEAGVKILNAGKPLEVTYCSIPFPVDWNNDGAKDLLVGQLDDGHILLFINQGTDLNPVFNGWTYLKSNGSPITTSFG